MKATKLFGLLTLLFAVFAVALLTEIPSFVKYKNGDILDFGELKAGSITDDDLIAGVIDVCDGSIAEMEETNTLFGIPTSKRITSRYYAVYSYNGEYFIYETADADECSTLDQLAEETDAFYNAVDKAYADAKNEDDVDLSDIERPVSTLEFTGRAASMSEDLLKIFREWYGEGFDTDCETAFVIRKCDYNGFRWTLPAMIGCAMLAVIMLLLTLISFFRGRRARSFSY